MNAFLWNSKNVGADEVLPPCGVTVTMEACKSYDEEDETVTYNVMNQCSSIFGINELSDEEYEGYRKLIRDRFADSIMEELRFHFKPRTGGGLPLEWRITINAMIFVCKKGDERLNATIFIKGADTVNDFNWALEQINSGL